MKVLVLLLFMSSTLAGKSYFTAPRTGDRFFVYDILINNFSVQNKDTLKKYILNRPDVFGGGCLPYQVSRNDKETENIKYSCVNHASEIGSRSFKEITAIRQSLIESACIEILNNKKNLFFVLRKAGITSKDKVTEKNIKKLAGLFFYKREPVNRYSKLISKKNVTSWKTITLTICKSPEWQVL